MSYFGTKDFKLEAARGLINGVSVVNQFGHAPDGIQTTITDFWVRANSTPTQQIWLAPTAARIHAIVSSSANDDANPSGTGCRTLKVYGLQSWDTAETSETISMDGTTPVNTANSYVIINKMVCVTYGASGANVGTITATAATDSTITAVILPTIGQTQQAIYGIPSIQNFYLTNYHISLKDTTTSKVTSYLTVNTAPNVQPAVFTVHHNNGVVSAGSSASNNLFNPYLKIEGPAIIKIQGLGSAVDLDAAASFDGYLVTE